MAGLPVSYFQHLCSCSLLRSRLGPANPVDAVSLAPPCETKKQTPRRASLNSTFPRSRTAYPSLTTSNDPAAEGLPFSISMADPQSYVSGAQAANGDALRRRNIPNGNGNLEHHVREPEEKPKEKVRRRPQHLHPSAAID